jgi:hypothetical protein
MIFRPKYITFDCYGTLTNFRMQDVAREMYADRVPAARMDAFTRDFAQYRLDEVMGDWRPYNVVLENAIRRTCKRWKVEYREGEGRKYYDAVPTWGPHPDVPQPLSRIAKEIPLVILSNAMDEQAAAARLRIHARPARLRAGGDPARLLEHALRPPVGFRHGHPQPGVRRARARAQQSGVWCPGDSRYRRAACARGTVTSP